jgi:PleD family two-component response regulator
MPPDARLSFSMGCALLRADEEVEQAIHRADESLYRAKTQGRDRFDVSVAA